MEVRLETREVCTDGVVPSQPPRLTVSTTLSPGRGLMEVQAVHHTESALWVGCWEGLISYREGQPTYHHQVRVYSITSRGDALFTLSYDSAFFTSYCITRWDTSRYPQLTQVWKQEVDGSDRLTAAGEKLVLCHQGYLTVYSCDRGQQLSEISYPGMFSYPLCGVEGQGVLVGVGNQLIHLPLDNQQGEPTPRYQCEEYIAAVCADGTSGRVFIATEGKKIIIITSSGGSV